MKPSEIISLARRQTGCTEDIVTPAEAYRFLNFVIEDFGADIRATDSWYWFNILNIDVTAGQPTYTYNQDDWSYMVNEDYPIWQPYPIHKIQSVWLKDKDWKWYDLPVHFVDKVDVQKFVSTNEPKACFITSNEVNLIPIPKESTQMEIWGWSYNREITPDIWEITVSSHKYIRSPENDVAATSYPYAWIRKNWNTIIYTNSLTPTSWTVYSDYQWTTSAWTVSDYEVTVTDLEANIFIPSRWHYIIVEWLKYWMYGNMWVNFETARGNSRSFYDSEKMKALQNITDRWQLADTAYFPNLNFLNY